MRMTTCVALFALATAACSPAGKHAGNASSDSAGARQDTLTRRQRDSIIGASKLPNARAVGKALNAADAEGAHNAAIDSANAAMSR